MKHDQAANMRVALSLAFGFLMTALVTLLASPAPVHAQSAKKREPKVIQLEEIKIEGRVQKPNAFYILNRSNLGYEVLDLRTSFVRDVVRAVQSDAF
jgi:hypothetical protein